MFSTPGRRCVVPRSPATDEWVQRKHGRSMLRRRGLQNLAMNLHLALGIQRNFVLFI